MRLEPAPIIVADVNIEKGLTFDYSEKINGAVGVGNTNTIFAAENDGILTKSRTEHTSDSSFHSLDGSTGFSSGCAGASSSGTSKVMRGGRRRPPEKAQKFKSKSGGVSGGRVDITNEPSENVAVKRRALEVAENFSKVARLTKSEVVPSGGLPSQ